MNAPFFQTLPDSCVWLNGTAASVVDWQPQPLAVAFINGCSVWCLERVRAVMEWQLHNPNRVQLVLVHVPRFDYDRDPDSVQELLRAESIHALAILDRDWFLWQRAGITAWPTLLIFDDQGHEKQRVVGTDNRESVWQCLTEHARAQLRSHTLQNVPGYRVNSLLSYPRAVAATPTHLYIADTGHHRVVECTHQGRIVRFFGTGTPGRNDGSLDEATFCRPGALVVDCGVVYVADSGNHAIRRIFLMNGHVDTLFGNGSSGPLSEGLVSSPSAVSLETPLSLALLDNILYFATGGDNRVWSYDLDTRRISRCAGNGSIDSRDGFSRFAAFSQPVALAGRQQMLYVCDALNSSIRLLQRRDEQIQTLVGGQRGRWEFGHEDGARASAQLQYPQGIALDSQSPYLWIADTGNQCLRRLRLGGGDLVTIDLPRSLQAPTGLAVSHGTVWIAETAAHAIVRYDIEAESLQPVELVDPYSV